MVDKIRHFSADLLQDFESMCGHMVEKFCDKDAKKGNFSDKMGFRNKSIASKCLSVAKIAVFGIFVTKFVEKWRIFVTSQ